MRNPGGRGLGPRPPTQTDKPKVDAYLWIGRPGFSAGGCNGDPRKIGTSWPKRALMFAAHASELISPGRPAAARR